MEDSEDSYNGDSDYASDIDYNTDEADADYDYATEANKSMDQESYTVLKESDIRQHQEEDIARVSAVLSLSKPYASVLLRHYKWSVSRVNEEWFANEAGVRKTVGLLDKLVVQPSDDASEVTCGICFESYPLNKFNTAACGHPFCTTCWRGYITTSINDGPGCLTLRCPEPSCVAIVGEDMIEELASAEEKEKYSRYFVRSYIEFNQKTKWCPAPGCEYAITFDTNNDNFDVSCSCSYKFCWNCTEESHRPVDCGTVAKWFLKFNSESENTNWILANSKPCPKCKRPIEKNHGCMHMTCRAPCHHQFCWLCLDPWTKHSQETGGFTACNRYEKANKEGEYHESEKRRKMAKISLERYTHYYERWISNHASRKKALADLHQMESDNLEKLSFIQCMPVTQLKFITEALVQIVECRRVLKWTYAYGYFLTDDEVAKKSFFEYLQGDAESYLERLHQCAEKELQEFLEADGASQVFHDFRMKLTGLTSVTKTYFENLVRALENGLVDVDSQVACSNSTSVK